jgi:hypothetical protein
MGAPKAGREAGTISSGCPRCSPGEDVGVLWTKWVHVKFKKIVYAFFSPRKEKYNLHLVVLIEI